MGKKKNKKLYLAVGTVIIVLVTVFCVNRKMEQAQLLAKTQDEKYQQAEALYEARNYTAAEEILQDLTEMEKCSKLTEQIEESKKEDYGKAMEAIAGKDYETAIGLLKPLTAYEDGDALLAYAKVCISDSRLDNHELYIHHIPKDYTGPFADEICAKREEVVEGYKEYREEKLEARPKKYVITARKANPNVRSSEEIFGESRKKKSQYSSPSYKNSAGGSGGIVSMDPYDVEWYDDPDDFADDWEDEFEDYDDAFMYWEDNH